MSKGRTTVDIIRDRLFLLLAEYPTMVDFAREVGVDRAVVSKWLCGKNVPRLETAVEICNRRRVSADWLLGFTNDPGRELHFWEAG